ncbi:Fic family protein [Candidatus Peregrinibacteria bacterium]|nr:MAG: Fic family protein [Candidatus Peregrinibacteria bacterium]
MFRYTLPVPTSIPTYSIKDVFKLTQSATDPDVLHFLDKFSNSDYCYWDTFRFKEPFPKSLNKEAAWGAVKLFRDIGKNKTIIQDEKKGVFTWRKLDYFDAFFHEIDMSTGGELFMFKGAMKQANKHKMMTRGIMEEAIASSQLEGAVTTRKAAKRMLREGAKPQNESEQMILNNYESMRAVEDQYKHRGMSMDLLLELHNMITKNTYDADGKSPILRGENDTVYVSDKSTGAVYHEGPPAPFVKRELNKLIQFANNEIENERFIHPIIKAIMLHFWVGYLHPFTDGNGRLARLIFYWYLIKEGYWAFTYLPISKVIKRSKKQYTMAYVYSEQDGRDLTYFIDYNIRKIQLAVQEFKNYAAKIGDENMSMKKRGEIEFDLNQRQIHLLQYFNGNPDERTSLKTHMNVNQVSKITALNDLKGLVAKGFLKRIKRGRSVYYYADDKISILFK